MKATSRTLCIIGSLAASFCILTQPSPLTGGPVEVAFEISSNRLASLYQTEYGVDVRPYLGNIDKIRCYRCLDTGFEFYAPSELAGPPEFYAELYSKEDNEVWAYQTEKWDYSIASRFVRPGARVLDVGCGGGDFLATLGPDVSKFGLETSSFGQLQARTKGLDVAGVPIEIFARSNRASFDVVTALQVLEHVPAPLEFLKACAEVLAPGGHLIIAVPNNDAFLGDNHELALNMPPHHMGRWRRRSLEAVADIIKLRLQMIECEPLAAHNLDWYQSCFEARYLPRSKIARSLWYRLGFSRAFSQFLKNARHTIHGHTIVAVYSAP